MIHLASISLKEREMAPDRFPFNVPAVRSLGTLSFTAPVTFFVGENGTGKSTLLEAIACAAGVIAVGSADVAADTTLDSVRELARDLRMSWRRRTRRGFFLRAEDFFGYTRHLATLHEGLLDDLRAVDEEYQSRSSYAASLARTPYTRELADLSRYYGDGLESCSHGESFLMLFRSRFVPDGLYLLDEPEAALSPLSQLGLLSLMKHMVRQNAQFIIATHSPVIMAFPEAAILSFDTVPIQEAVYSELEHVKLTRDFLSNPEAFLRHL